MQSMMDGKCSDSWCVCLMLLNYLIYLLVYIMLNVTHNFFLSINSRILSPSSKVKDPFTTSSLTTASTNHSMASVASTNHSTASVPSTERHNGLLQTRYVKYYCWKWVNILTCIVFCILYCMLSISNIYSLKCVLCIFLFSTLVCKFAHFWW